MKRRESYGSQDKTDLICVFSKMCNFRFSYDDEFFRTKTSPSIFSKKPEYEDSLFEKYNDNDHVAPTFADSVFHTDKYGSGIDVDGGFGTVNHGWLLSTGRFSSHHITTRPV